MSTSTGEVLYSFSTPYPDVLVRARLCKVRMPVYRSGALVAPTQAGSTFSLVGPDGTLIVDAAAVTVSGSIATYSIPSASLPSTLTLGEGYQERWTLVLADRTETVDREAALCVRPLYPVLSDADLTRRYANLTRLLPSGTTSFQSKLDAAWEEILRRLAREGHLSYGIKSPDQLSQSHFHLTMAYLYDDASMAQPATAAWTIKADKERELYNAAWSPATWRADDDLDGRVDDVSARRGATVVVQSGGSPAWDAHTYARRGI